MKKLMTLFLAIVLALSALAGGMLTVAADTVEREFDSTPVLEDLTSSRDEDGNAFDLTDYPYDENGRVQLITLVEYCYSYATNMRDNYALYLYLYNPTGAEIVTDSDLNKAQFAVSYDDEGKPDDYEQFDVVFCNKSTGDYNNLFYKFRVTDHESADGMTMGERVNSNLRRYDLSGVYLLHKGDTNATAYGCGGTYKYSGYAAGYGPDENAGSTLTSEVTELEVLETKVHGTVYRPEGSFYKGEQDQLNSVFFTVPNYFFEEYGKISSIKARWDEYRTHPIFVTENSKAAQEYAQYVGKDISQTDYTGDIGAWVQEHEIDSPTTGIWDWILGLINPGYGKIYYYDYAWIYNLRSDNPNNIEKRNVLSAVFDTKGGSYENYTVSGEDLQQRLLETSQELGGELINGKYSAALFSDEVDNGHTRGENVVTVDSDYKFSLTSYYLTQNFWQQIFGGSTINSTEYEDIKAIVEVNSDDLKDKDDATVSQELYVGAEDVQTLRDEVANAEKNDSRVILFHYAVSKYYSYPVNYTVEYDDADTEYEMAYSDGYVAEETVFLDFTLIQIKFYKEGVYTVIPVVADPIDVFGPVSPPLDDDPIGGGGCAATGWTVFWVIALVLVAVVIVIIVVTLIKARLSRSTVTVNYSPPNDGGGGGSGGKSRNAASPESAAKRAEQAAKRAERSAKSAQKSANTAKYAQKEGNKSAGKSKNSGKNKGNTGGKAHSKAAGKTGSGKAIGKANSRKK